MCSGHARYGIRESLPCPASADCSRGVRGQRQQRGQRGAVEVACINGPDETVLAGSINRIDALCQRLTELGHKFTKLPIPFAFHSSQVAPVLTEFEDIARRVSFQTPAIPVVSTLLGTVVRDSGVFGPQYLRRHCREPVNFLGAIESAKQEGLLSSSSACVEIGTHPILTRMMKGIVQDDRIHSYPSLRFGEDMFKTMTESLRNLYLADVPIDWQEYHRDDVASHKVVGLPGYSWDLQDYWIQYRNNFCLTKGELTSPTGSSLEHSPRARSIRLSDSVQEIVEEISSDDAYSIVIQSDMTDPEILPVVLNHKVNGLTLCPSVSSPFTQCSSSL